MGYNKLNSYTLEISYNNWQDKRFVKIKANYIVQINNNVINIDGIEMKFEEPVNLINK